MPDRRHDIELLQAQIPGMVGPIRRAGNAEDIGDVELSAHRLSRRVRSVRFAVAIHRDTVVAAEATYGLLGPAIGDGRSVDLASVVPNRVRALPYPQRAANGAGRQHSVTAPQGQANRGGQASVSVMLRKMATAPV